MGRLRLSLALLVILAACTEAGAHGSASASFPPAPAVARPMATPDPMPTPSTVPTATRKPTPSPKPTPKPAFTEDWRVGACRTMQHIELGDKDLGRAGGYVYSGDWSMVRLMAAGARTQELFAVRDLPDRGDWKAGAAWLDATSLALGGIGNAADAWELAATFQTLGAASDAVDESNGAVDDATAAIARFKSLTTKYRFDCSGVDYPDS